MNLLFYFQVKMMLLVIIILLPNISLTKLLDVTINRTDNVSSLVKDIFLQFRNYIKVFHFDNSSLDIIANMNETCCNILLNYENLNSKIRMHREKEAYFHLLLINKKRLRHPNLPAERLQSIDVVFFLILNENYDNQSDLCMEPYIHQADRVFIYDFPLNKAWCCEYFCGKHFSQKRKILVYQRNIPYFGSYKRRCKHFEGYSFRVGYTETIPLIQTR